MAAGEAAAGGGPEHTEHTEHARRSVVPKQIQTAAGRSLWPAAIWTGLGAAVVCATLAIVAVAACWLPVSGSSGRTNSAIRAGLLTFLAALRGGITIDGVTATWLPLGMTMIVGLAAWRAGSGLADAAEYANEQDPLRLALAGLAQVLSFTVGALIAVPFATLGTSRAPFVGVAAGAGALFTVTGGAAYVRSCALRSWVVQRTPTVVGTSLRGGAAAVLVYLAGGAVLTAASLAVHHDQAERLSRSVGGGMGGVPVLLLGVLAAPNAAIAAAAYLAGPGFALGAGTHVGLFGAAHGVLPAFPVLAAVPGGAAPPAALGLAAAMPLLAGVLVARVAIRIQRWLPRLGCALGAVLAAGVAMTVLGWQGGGAVGDDRLHTVGASPWRFGVAVAAAVAATTLVCLGLAAVWRVLRREREDDTEESLFEALRFPRMSLIAGATRDDDDRDDGEDQVAHRAG